MILSLVLTHLFSLNALPFLSKRPHCCFSDTQIIKAVTIQNEKVSLPNFINQPLIVDLDTTLFTVTNSTLHLNDHIYVSSSPFPTIANLTENSFASLKHLKLEGRFGNDCVFVLSSSTLALVSFSISCPNSIFSPKSLVRSDGHSSLSISDSHFSNLQVSGEEPLLASSSISFVQASRSSFANISLPTPTDQLLLPARSFGEWELDGCKIANTCGATSGIVFCDTNWASSFICSNSSFLDSPSLPTTPNPNSNTILRYSNTEWQNYRTKMVEPACLLVEGPGLEIDKSRFQSNFDFYTGDARARGILFFSPNNDISLSDVRINNFSDQTAGSGLLVLGATNIVLKDRSFFYWNWVRQYGGAVMIFAKPDTILIDSSIFDENKATGTLYANAGGVFVCAKCPYALKIFNSTFYRQESAGTGGGLAFSGVVPFTTINSEYSWFVSNFGLNWGVGPTDGGSFAFDELENATGVSVIFDTCRFNASTKEGRGHDIYCFSGWETVITQSSFPCSVASRSSQSIYVDGVTGDKDDFWMAYTTPDQCDFIPYRSFYFDQEVKGIPYWVFMVLYTGSPFIISAIVVVVFILRGCYRRYDCCEKFFRMIAYCFCWPLGIYRCHSDRKDAKRYDYYDGHRMNTRKKVTNTAYLEIPCRRWDISGYLSRSEKQHKKQKKTDRIESVSNQQSSILAESAYLLEKSKHNSKSSETKKGMEIKPCKSAEQNMFTLHTVNVFSVTEVPNTRRKAELFIAEFE
ncbi:hypothetical protein BLNAU_19787 [Blattamonas nauphoetae]|uniref:Uncharacterized protein n=1 Tax=Blattamonas nauphoetae TaxID=2049346 RepID=A0ABQ9X0G4_9EUKA|nr:hypothetical protein BLNAU_19787 [Blattamonas nauphoetae]